MTVMSFDGTEWAPDRVANVPVQFRPPVDDAAGVLVVLPDAEWPDATTAVLLNELLRTSGMGAVVPDLRPWWIDRPDPALTPARSPLAFVNEGLVPWMEGRFPGPPRLAVLGAGLAGQGALQLAYRFPQRFPMVAAITPAIDFHRLHDSSPVLQEWFETQERARQETATLRLHPLNWPPRQWFACPRGDWRFDGCERLASKLTSMGIPFEADLDTPAGPGYGERQLRRALELIAEWQREPPVSAGIRMSHS